MLEAAICLRRDIRIWRVSEKAVWQLRVESIEEIFDKGGLSKLLELARQVECPYYVGLALGHSKVLDGREEQILNQGLGSDDPVKRDLAFGLLIGRTKTKGLEWLEGLHSSTVWNGWNSQQRADYYLCPCLPFSKKIWDLLSTEENGTQRLYWSKVDINFRGDIDPDDCAYIARELTKQGRLWVAVDFLGLYSHKFHRYPTLVAEILERFSTEDTVEKSNWGPLANGISKLLNLLEASGEIDNIRLAQLELSFIPLFRNMGRHLKSYIRLWPRIPSFLLGY